MSTTHNLQALFKPRGIAVVGASATPGKLGYVMAQAISTYPGGAYSVNPGSPDMYRSVEEAAAAAVGNLDLVISCIPAQHTADMLRTAANAGVGAALICAGGFAEAGGPGIGYQEAVEEVVRDTGIRVLGPNTSGFFIPHAGLRASFVPGVEALSPGGIAVVSSSGGVNHATSFSLERSGAGVSLGVGLGAGFDVAAPEVIEYLADDPTTSVIALHLETVTDGDALLSAVTRASISKPVVVFVVGENDVAEFAQSHTGALATSWKVTRSALGQAGAVIVDSEIELVNAAIALAGGRIEPKENPGIGLITGQAGPGLIMADRLAGYGVALPQLQENTLTQLSEYLPPLTYQANPVDTGRPSEKFPDVIRAVAQDESIDAVGVYGILEPVVDMVGAIDQACPGHELPVLLGIDGLGAAVQDSQRAGQEKSTPTLAGPSALAQALTALVKDSKAQYRRSRVADEPVEPLALGQGPWDEAEAKRLLAEAGVRIPRNVLASDEASARTALGALNTPVAAKLVDAEVLHKTEIGGVRLGISSEVELEDAIRALTAVGARQFLIEEMAAGGIDLVVGARRDEVFGPVVLIGLGGTTAEALADVSLRLAPVSQGAVNDMVNELLGAKILQGWREGPVIDTAELHHVVSILGQTLISNPHIDEIEINPLRLTDSGLIALDAVIVQGDGQAHGNGEEG